MKIAIIGAGISGLGAAYALRNRGEIAVYEREPRIGGHSHTMTIDYDGTPVAVDTGFIVYNTLNYPNLTALFDTLDVPTEASNMSFAVSIGGGRLEWSGDSLRTLFAQKRNLLRPRFHAMWMDILRFNRRARADLASGHLAGMSLGAYLALRGFGRAFRDDYLVPMGAAIWSSAPDRMLDFPAESFIRFFDNHRLIDMKRPLWRTVSGGSREYVSRLVAALPEGAVRAGTGSVRVARTPNGVLVTDGAGAVDRFDQVVFACHSDEALAALGEDASPEERAVLGDIGYAPNDVYLHRDPALMPRRRRVWASWNYMCDGSGRTGTVSVSYWMNRLQNIDARMPLFVSLNPPVPPRAERMFARLSYAHPQFDGPALGAQRRLATIQGVQDTWFCGAWCGYGFHEDGLKSGLEVAEALGGVVPWGSIGTPRIGLGLTEAAE